MLVQQMIATGLMTKTLYFLRKTRPKKGWSQMHGAVLLFIFPEIRTKVLAGNIYKRN